MASNPTDDYSGILKDLAHTMMSVSRESVNLIKRSDQQQALKLKRKQEWDIYLEFLRMLFNLVDRLSAFYVPLQAQRDFMNSLEDSVSHELKTVLAPSLSSTEIDDMEVMLSVGQTVAESREVYERFKFVVTDQTKERDEYFKFFSDRVAAKAGGSGKTEITSAAFLCGSAVIPALKSLFEDAGKPKEETSAEKVETVAKTSQASDESPVAPSGSATPLGAPEGTSGESLIKLISVVSRVQGEEEIETWWGLHPKFRSDLPANETKELSKLMNRATRIVGERYAVVVSLAQAGVSRPVGNA